ncbi:MAG: cytochrome C, partial [Bacteroidia bacterium]|nr:cytochrome C [Bacteroidia bacterium]
MKNTQETLAKTVVNLTFLLLVVVVGITFIGLSTVFLLLNPSILEKKEKTVKSVSADIKTDISNEFSDPYWKAPLIDSIPANEPNKELILYGRDLIAHTAKYLGPKGSVAQITNGMNCQNCHLKAGTQPLGNNYGAVAANYPKFRARSGTI